MAVRTISTRLAIDGQAAYKQAISTINGELKNMQSALKLVESEYKDNANSMAALTAKGNALSQVYASQQQKVSTLKDALTNAQKAQQSYASQIESTKSKISAVEKEMADLANSTGNTTKKQAELKAQLEKLNAELAQQEAKAAAAQKGVNGWERQLNEAKVELNSINGEIDKNSAYLDEAKTSTDQCATSIDKFGKITEEGKRKAAGFGKTSKEAVDTLSAALAAAGLTRALKEIADAITACTNASIEFESALTGVFKTVDGTDQQLAKITAEIKQMALEVPTSTTELAGIAEAAGQLGIQVDNITAFTRVMADLGVATNISSSEGAMALAQFANIVQMSQKDFERLGSTIVDLGNHTATTEADILEMAKRLAGAGAQIGLTEAQIMGFAAALTSVGIEAEAGGTAFSRVFSSIQAAVETGNESLADFARVSGLSIEEFSRVFQEDAAGAITLFIEGLSKMDEQGISSIVTLDEMGISQLRLRDTLLRSSNAGNLVRETLDLASKAWAENSALAVEASKRYETTESKLRFLANAAEGTERAIGDVLTPALVKIAEAGTKGFEWATEFIEQNPWLVQALTAVVVAVGVLGGALLAYTVITKIAAAVTTAFNAALTASPVGVIAVAIGALISAIGVLVLTTESATTETDNFVASLNESKKAFEDNIAAIDEQARSNESLITSLTALTEKENKTSSDKATILSLVKQLNEAVPELSLAYDEQADSLNMTEDAMRGLASAQIAYARQQANVARLTTLYIEQADTAAELAEKQGELKDAQKEYDKALKESPLGPYDKRLNDVIPTVSGLQKEVDNLTQAQEANNAAIADAEGKINSYSAATTANADASALAASTIINSAAELEAAYATAYDAAYASINDQIGLWEDMGSTAATSAEDVNAALESQIKYMEEYTSNLTALADRNIDGIDSLVSQLSDGSRESASILAGLADASDEEIAALIENLGKVEEGKVNFSSIMAEMATDFSAKADEIEQRMVDMVKEFDQSSDARTNAQETMDGLIAGLESRKDELQKMVNEINRLMNKVGTEPEPDGSHAGGLSYVPYDGYIAELHQGERILTAAEAQSYINRSIPRNINASTVSNSTSRNLVVNIYPRDLNEGQTSNLIRRINREFGGMLL